MMIHPRHWHLTFSLFLVLALVTPTAHAQRGDRKGHEMKEVWKDMDVPSGDVVPAHKALQTFRIAPGFRLELVAAEPLIEDPVAIAWDEDGRLWAVEMRGYMPNVDGTGEDVRNGQVVVLEDTNGDGKMDKSTVFLDKLQMPRALAITHGGVIVAEPPYLWFCKDTDGDLKCDEKVKVYTGYARQGPVEHTDNGLMRGLDNWFHNAKSSKMLRFVMEDGKLKAEETSAGRGRGQWGITQDNYGRLYYNSNSSYLQHEPFPPHYFARNPHHKGRGVGGGSIASDQTVYSIRVNPGINRGYQSNMLRDDGRLARTTATCGPGIYRGDQFPKEYVGHAFVPEPSGNVVSHFAINEKDGRVRAQHVAYDDPDWGKREFMACVDERFRPVNAYTGPDGCMYVVDMYRGILQHRVYVTTFLRKQIIERKLDKPIGMGRVYRIVHEGKKPGPLPRMSKAGTADLVGYLSHANGWWRDTAQRLLVERRDPAAVPLLEKVVATSKNDLARLHALWTLEGLDGVSVAAVNAGISAKDAKVRQAAVRLSPQALNRKLEDEFAIEDQQALLTRMLSLADDKDAEVRLYLACSLGGVKHGAAGDALRALLSRDGSSPTRDGVLSGLHKRELEFLQRTLADEQWTKDERGKRDVITALATCVVIERNAQRVKRLLDLAASQDEATAWRGEAILRGVVAVTKGKGRKPKPLYYDTQPRAMVKLAKHDNKRVRALAEEAGAFIKFGEAPPPPKPPRVLTTEELKRFTMGKQLYGQTCGGCHQTDGLGEEGKAPPLLDSHIALGRPEKLIRIAMHGLTGPVEVHGRVYDMTMPGVQGFTDEQFAAVLTFVRRNWEHGGEPVTPAMVADVRRKTKGRELPWTIKELEKLGAK